MKITSKNGHSRTAAARPFDRSYWVEPGKLLAGAYPGEVSVAGTEHRMWLLLDAGIRTIVCLQQEGEVDHAGRPFTPYDGAFGFLAASRGVPAACERFPIPDLGVTTVEAMKRILDCIDDSIARDMPVYVHCWGGVGRTGTAVGCWLRRHGKASASAVMDTIARLRIPDPVSDRQSPETGAQQRMVLEWKQGQ